MTEYILVARPGGFYSHDPERNPTIEADLDFLLDADAHAPGSEVFYHRGEVLIERIEVPMEAAS